MHIPDGLLDPKLSGSAAGLAAMVLSYCLTRVRQAVTAVVPQAALATAGQGTQSLLLGGRRVITKFGENLLIKMTLVITLILAAQSFDFVVVSGASGHLLGGAFAALMLGPFAGTLAMTAVLIIQHLFFADGGLIALGTNIINIAVIGSFSAYFIYSILKKIIGDDAGIFIAACTSVLLSAAACSVEIGSPAMLKVHFLVGFAEGLITLGAIKLLSRFTADKNS